MAFLPLKIPPGISRPGTKYDARGRWYDCNLVRWHEKAMKPWGGWQIVKDGSGDEVNVGSAIRTILPWMSNAQVAHLALATYCELFIFADNVLTDISPAGITCGGVDSTVSGAPYGVGLYGVGPYSRGGFGTKALTEANTWQLDTFGEDLVAVAYADGKLYYWDLSEGVGTAAQAVVSGATITGAEVDEAAPENNRGVVVTPERIVVALAAGGNGRRVAWCDQEDVTVWAPEETNQAGDFLLTTPGEILAGRRGRNETLIWTTTDLHTMRYIGGDYVYSFHELGANCGAISRQSMVVVDGKAIWMGRRGFFVYDGYVRPIDNEIADFVFGDPDHGVNLVQAHKIVCFPRAEFGEIVWYYPSAASVENDRYVAYNYLLGYWTIGALERTAGADRGAYPYPVAADAAGNLYQHEISQSPSYLDVDGVTELTPYAESGPIEIAQGDNVMIVREIIPDEKTLGSVQASMYASFYPTSAETKFGPFTAANPTKCRLTGRQVRLRVEGGGSWRVGTFRLDAVLGGLR